MQPTDVPRATTGRGIGLGLVVAVFAVLALSAFAGGADAGAATRATASVITSAENTQLGPILVAGNRAVYTLKPSKTGCSSACVKTWLPVLLPHGVKTPSAGSGVDASKLGTAELAKGALQITYSGKRLYWFANDKAPRQAHGNATTKWGKWLAVRSSSGSKVTATTPAPSTAAPSTEAPVATAPPETVAPAPAPPETSPPVTSPPATQPTNPPRTQPPTTNPGNGGVGF